MTTHAEIDAFCRLEESLWRPETRSDSVWLDGILSEDFTEYCRFGHIYDRDHLINAPSSDIEVEFPFDDFHVEILASNVALITYQNTVTYQGRRQTARRSSVWIEGENGWKLKFMQATTRAD